MQNTSKHNRNFWQKTKRFLLLVLTIFALLNLIIFLTGNTYLYKGIQATYLQGKTGPGIYDSLTFHVREGTTSGKKHPWNEKNTLVSLSDSSIQRLKATKTTSFLIIQNGEIIHESYYGNHKRHTKSNSFSMAKSFIGLMIGIAIDRGEIKSFDEPIINYLPFRLPNDEAVTIRHLLGMSSGLDWTESGSNPLSDNAAAYYTTDLRKIMENEAFIKEPGIHFNYASGNSQLLGVILKKATGKTPTEYFEKHVWRKINPANNLFWSLDQENGMEKTFCCVYATSRDYARIGQLILNQGSWGDTEVISNRNLTKLIQPFNPKYAHYGLHFWRFNHPITPAVYARGILGQYIIAIPTLNVVMVRTGHERKKKYFIPKNKQNDFKFIEKNKYKEYHPLDLFEYFSILDEVLKQAQE
ncbi:serine hydrolase [Brumimicrobium salinarum]|uniref:Serine hydrolase n=1 Tax=Brumimicrobium salinarum TaxID=2058658 RepID=A0A2I0R6U3_9FLAO|nr:serine hydrolase [Brumimicrobium salinarum]PKR82269.1 serine hydrolase [Brumimicrobium salinarum]